MNHAMDHILAATNSNILSQQRLLIFFSWLNRSESYITLKVKWKETNIPSTTSRAQEGGEGHGGNGQMGAGVAFATNAFISAPWPGAATVVQRTRDWLPCRVFSQSMDGEFIHPINGTADFSPEKLLNEANITPVLML